MDCNFSPRHFINRPQTEVAKKKIHIHTDGACSGNPGPGGFAAILVYGEQEKIITGGDYHTTNNRMEMLAIIEGLKVLKERCDVTVFSDSKYVCDSINLGWAKGWRARGWKKADNKPALNSDLWEELLDLCESHDVSFVWVKGHAGDEYNERCDRLAVEESQKRK